MEQRNRRFYFQHPPQTKQKYVQHVAVAHEIHPFASQISQNIMSYQDQIDIPFVPSNGPFVGYGFGEQNIHPNAQSHSTFCVSSPFSIPFCLLHCISKIGGQPHVMNRT